MFHVKHSGYFMYGESPRRPLRSAGAPPQVKNMVFHVKHHVFFYREPVLYLIWRFCANFFLFPVEMRHICVILFYTTDYCF